MADCPLYSRAGRFQTRFPRVPLSSQEAAAAGVSAPPPTPPFTDYRYEKPGTVRKITLKDLPPPFASTSSGNGPEVVPRPPNAWPQVLPGFKAEQYASDLNNPRLMRTAPNGDVFLAETRGGDIRIFRGITADGKPGEVEVFASGLNQPFGINFYPPGPNPQWVYVGNTDSVVRFPYQNGDLKARGPAEHLADLPTGPAIPRATSSSRRMARKCGFRWVRARISTIPIRPRPRKIVRTCWSLIRTARVCGFTLTASGIVWEWRSIRTPVNCGVP